MKKKLIITEEEKFRILNLHKTYLFEQWDTTAKPSQITSKPIDTVGKGNPKFRNILPPNTYGGEDMPFEPYYDKPYGARPGKKEVEVDSVKTTKFSINRSSNRSCYSKGTTTETPSYGIYIEGFKDNEIKINMNKNPSDMPTPSSRLTININDISKTKDNDNVKIYAEFKVLDNNKASEKLIQKAWSDLSNRMLLNYKDPSIYIPSKIKGYENIFEISNLVVIINTCTPTGVKTGIQIRNN